MDMSALQKAIPVAPKPTKQRTLEVKCPMCETLGYVTAPQHQGKDVKCANPDCKHPYFVVPLPKKDSGDSGLKKKKGLSIAQVLTLVVAGLGLAGRPSGGSSSVSRRSIPSTQPTIKPITPVVQDDVKPKDKELGCAEANLASMKFDRARLQS